jgi:hypothetical protein
LDNVQRVSSRAVVLSNGQRSGKQKKTEGKEKKEKEEEILSVMVLQCKYIVISSARWTRSRKWTSRILRRHFTTHRKKKKKKEGEEEEKDEQEQEQQEEEQEEEQEEVKGELKKRI